MAVASAVVNTVLVEEFGDEFEGNAKTNEILDSLRILDLIRFYFRF